jgi:hypothetical protein
MHTSSSANSCLTFCIKSSRSAIDVIPANSSLMRSAIASPSLEQSEQNSQMSGAAATRTTTNMAAVRIRFNRRHLAG